MQTNTDILWEYGKKLIYQFWKNFELILDILYKIKYSSSLEIIEDKTYIKIEI